MASRFDEDSDEEVERFEVTDYDLENEFNPNRRQHRQSKNQATYGIWAAREDSDEDGGGRTGLGGGKRQDLSQGLDFVSGGFKQTSEEMKKEMEEEEEENNEEMDPLLDFTGSRKKLYKSKGTSSFRKQAPSSTSIGKSIGTWEKHTKGIGQKLLLQMGYQPGKGLGKTGQGIVIPVEAHKRKGKGAISYHGPERPNKPPQVDSEDEEDEDFRRQLSQWKKGPEAKQKPKYSYKTIDDVKEKAKTSTKKSRLADTALTKVKVIDMTGKEKRVLSGYDQISQKHSRPDEDSGTSSPITIDQTAFTMPELQHNLDLLVEMAEQEIIKNDRQLHHEEDTVVHLRHEEVKLNEILVEESKQINKLKEIMVMIERCEERQQQDSMEPWELEDAYEFFKTLQENFYEEYRVYELPNLVIATVFPLVKEYLSSWDPLQNNSYGMDVFKLWKDLVDNNDNIVSQEGMHSMSVYNRLVWEVWMPYLRTAVTKWNPRDCDPVIELLENWLPILPQWITANVLDQLILPNLQKEVEGWNPLTDTQRIDSWLHPWLPLMGTRLEPLYAPIRQKLSHALTNWHPSDISAKTILLPWKPVFSQGTMDAFLIRNISPKLVVCLQELVINPYQQHLDPFHWVMAWEDLLPKPNLATMLHKHFFPKWLNVLCSWLSNKPDFAEVTKWYSGWKSMFSEELLNIPMIKDQFTQALDLMNRAVSGNPVLTPFAANERRQEPDPVETESV
ncbi:tuftelin-interacting protein 11, partial [Saccoglossus kowalevskii]|uniref:Tuftelin-interacting protein 11 n=1 Tax=Saccoglossus kowalevskii TaxID=10224 RepID=A0ABM0GSR5_SACKO